MTVTTGLDRLLQGSHGVVKGRAVALLAHPASVDSKFRPADQVLTQAGARVQVLLGPEHGVSGEAQDMEGVENGPNQEGLRTYSLYGDSEESLRPTREMLDGVQCVVADLQDVGSRYYTFVWTAALCLEECARHGLELILLDRPNPLNGNMLEGPGIQNGFRSFVGHFDIITRHGMTIAEILQLYAMEHQLQDHLKVLPMVGWSRNHWFDQTGLPWIFPSPNMPTLDTAVVYPGMCLLEGTNVSEGRGTTRPFEIIGAPWLEGETLVATLDRETLPGCVFRPLNFKPMFHKHAGEVCGGIQIHVTNREEYRPLRTGVALLRALRQLGGARFHWRTEPYEFVTDRLPIDLLAGGSWLREGIESRASVEEICCAWGPQETSFADRRRSVLLYKPD